MFGEIIESYFAKQKFQNIMIDFCEKEIDDNNKLMKDFQRNLRRNIESSKKDSNMKPFQEAFNQTIERIDPEIIKELTERDIEYEKKAEKIILDNNLTDRSQIELRMLFPRDKDICKYFDDFKREYSKIVSYLDYKCKKKYTYKERLVIKSIAKEIAIGSITYEDIKKIIDFLLHNQGEINFEKFLNQVYREQVFYKACGKENKVDSFYIDDIREGL